MNLVLVFFGGGLGSLCRYLFGLGFIRTFGPTRPYISTFMINIIGSFLMGVLIGVLSRLAPVSDRWRLFFGLGILGGFTTFSSYSLEAVLLIQRKSYGLAAAYIGGSVLLGVLFLMAGLMLVRRTAT